MCHIKNMVSQVLMKLNNVWAYTFSRCNSFSTKECFDPRPFLAFGYCRCLRLSVCVSVCVCGIHMLVRTITHHPFERGSPNLDHRCKRLNDFVVPLACNCVQILCTCALYFLCLYVCIWIVFLGNNLSPNKLLNWAERNWTELTLVKIPFVLRGDCPWPSRSNLTSKSKFTPFWACPRNNSSPVQARATKFGPEVLNTLVKIPVVLGVD